MNKQEEQDFRFQPGGGYCFPGWSAASHDGPSRQKVATNSSSTKDEFSEWRHWMKDYLKERSEDERSQTPNTDSKPEEVAWNTHVQQARELQKQRAQNIASAIQSTKQSKTARMFQKRFERSEKYAFISEPGDRRPPIPSVQIDQTKEEVQQDVGMENQNEESQQDVHGDETTEAIQAKSHSTEDAPDGSLDLHPTLPLELSFLNIQPTNNTLLVSPKPWTQKAEPLPPPAPHKNFNRAARGFAGSYITSYY